MGDASTLEVKTRASTVDGIFYPAEARDLRQLVAKLIDQAPGNPGRASAIITPHAAYPYSGAVAACAYKAAAGRQVELAVLIGPVHREPAEGILLPESRFFQTPLGLVPVHLPSIEALLSCSTGICCNDIPHLEEHCLEVQLPFLQHLHPEAEIVPVLMGNSEAKNVKLLANALQLTFSPRLESTLFVATSNMGPLSDRKVEPAAVERLLELMVRRDWQELLAETERGPIAPCGTGCIAVILALSELLGKSVRVLKRGNSASAAPEDRNVVHYAAVSVTREEGASHGLHPDSG